MDHDEAVRLLTDEAQKYRRAAKALDEARERMAAAIVAARRAGVRPTDVDQLSPFVPAYNRRIAREAGIEPGRPGPKRQ
jgi:hypothetical protein